MSEQSERPATRVGTDGPLTGDWEPNAGIVAALHDAAVRQDFDAYLNALLDSSLAMPADPNRGEWPLVDGPDGEPLLPLFTSLDALRSVPAGASGPYTVWPVLDLLAEWPDPDVHLLIDATLPTQAWIEPGVVAALAKRSAEIYPFATALRATNGEPERYIQELLMGDVVVPIGSADSRVRDVTDPEFAWWLDDPTDAPGSFVLFSSAVRMHARLGDVPWVVAPFVHVLLHCPTGRNAMIDPDFQTGVGLPIDLVATLREQVEKVPEDERVY